MINFNAGYTGYKEIIQQTDIHKLNQSISDIFDTIDEEDFSLPTEITEVPKENARPGKCTVQHTNKSIAILKDTTNLMHKLDSNNSDVYRTSPQSEISCQRPVNSSVPLLDSGYTGLNEILRESDADQLNLEISALSAKAFGKSPTLLSRVIEGCKSISKNNPTIQNVSNVELEKTNEMALISSSQNVRLDRSNLQLQSYQRFLNTSFNEVYNSFKLLKNQNKMINFFVVFGRLNVIFLERNNLENSGYGSLSDFKKICKIYHYALKKQNFRFRTMMQMFYLYPQILKHYKNEDLPHHLPLYMTDRLFQIAEQFVLRSGNDCNGFHLKTVSEARKSNQGISNFVGLHYLDGKDKGYANAVFQQHFPYGDPKVLSYSSYLNCMNVLHSLECIFRGPNRIKFPVNLTDSSNTRHLQIGS